MKLGQTIGVVLALGIMAACGDGITNPSATVQSDACSIVVNGNGNNASCRDSNVTQPQASPTPSPSGAGTCPTVVDYLRSNGPDFVGVGQEVTFGITPMQFTGVGDAAREIPPQCNEAKTAPKWTSSDTRILTVAPFGTGFEAKVKRLGTSSATITVEFEGRLKVWGVQGARIEVCKKFICPDPGAPATPTPTPKP